MTIQHRFAGIDYTQIAEQEAARFTDDTAPKHGSHLHIGFGRAVDLGLADCERHVRLESRVDNSWKRVRHTPWRYQAHA